MTAAELARFVSRECVPSHVLTRNRHGRSYVIGVAGTSPAVGKTALASLIAETLGEHRSAHLDLDNWIRVSRSDREAIGTSGIDPANWDLTTLVASLETLIISGIAIREPVYDHETGTPNVASRGVEPANVVCLAGASCLWTDVRPFINFTLCITPQSEAVGRRMAMKRNTTERKYSPQRASVEYARTIAAYDRHVTPWKRYADIALCVDSGYSYQIT